MDNSTVLTAQAFQSRIFRMKAELNNIDLVLAEGFDSVSQALVIVRKGTKQTLLPLTNVDTTFQTVLEGIKTDLEAKITIDEESYANLIIENGIGDAEIGVNLIVAKE